MFIFLVIVTIILLVLLLGVAGIRPPHDTLSLFELERRSAHDKKAVAALRREGLLPDILSLQRVIVALLLVVTVLLCVSTFGWLFGVLFALIIALEYGALARIPVLQRSSQNLYKRIEPSLLDFTQKVPWLFELLRSTPNWLPPHFHTVDSREELQYVIAESGNILTSDEKKLLVNGLSFGDKQVSEVMTPRSVIDSIKKSEFLGPLTLDDLHKTGHNRLPVINGDIDHVVGILHLQNLLTLDVKRSVTAEKAMDPRVLYIREDQTLHHALAAFLRTHHHLFIVVNEFRETVGLVTLEDIMEALLGRKIVDEFDAHDDLRAVALRNPRGNNEPEKHQDV